MSVESNADPTPGVATAPPAESNNGETGTNPNIAEGKSRAKRTARKRAKSKPRITANTLDLRSPAARTDLANTRRLVKRHGTTMRWCDPWGKWVIWDGRRWAVDQERRAESLAKDVASTLWADVAKLLPDVGGDTAIELVRFAHATASARGIANMLTLARSEADIPILPESLDAHPWLLNCANGTLDLQTGKLLPHDRGHNLSKLLPHDYVQGAEGESPKWDEFLATIFAENANMIRFVQRLFGSSLLWAKCLTTCCQSFGARGQMARAC